MGLGGRFPAGYPVGKVTQFIADAGQPFARVTAEPSAELDRSRNVLLVWSSSDSTAQQQSSQAGVAP